MTHTRVLGVVLAGCAWLAGPALAQQGTTVTLRATGPHIYEKPEFIKFIAANSDGFQVSMPDAVDPALTTPARIMAHFCGTVRQEYIDIFLEANRERMKGRRLDEPLGEGAKNMVWPACLHVDAPPAPGRRVKVLAHETSATDVCVRLTGGGCGAATLAKFFKGSVDQKVDLNVVREGMLLLAAHATRPVLLSVNGMSTEAFLQGLYDRLGGKESADTWFRKIDSVESGEVIIAEAAECTASDKPPYAASAVAAAYRRAFDAAFDRGGELTMARVVVIDNGFFGANPKPDPAGPLAAPDAWFKDSPFSRRYFQFDDAGQFALPLKFTGRPNYPINYLYASAASPDLVSGHGTHVTGLVMGGPEFDGLRDAIRRDRSLWLRISVANVGEGRKTLIENAEQVLPGSLPPGGHIVNMSIAYGRSVTTTFDDYFKKTPGNLYVLAAGNNYGLDVADRVFPAGSGGLASPNVLTVAALDGEGRFARFSNIGPANVDLAAPGCEIKSWIRNDPKPVEMSGTSQAAPIVTFTAALLRSVAASAPPHLIKSRLVASGSLLHPFDQKLTATRVALHVQRAMFWYDDYVRVGRGANRGEYIGTVQAVTGLGCESAGSTTLDNLWSFKRGQVKAWTYIGRRTSALNRPCKAAEQTSAAVRFTATHRIDEGTGELQEIRPPTSEVIPLAGIDEIVMRAPKLSP